MTAYIDASAAIKLVINEPESPALLREILAHRDSRLVSSWLLHTDMHCAIGRHPQAVTPEAVEILLATLDLVDLTRGDLLAAGTHAPLRSGDAIHLAAALRVGVDEMVTYDRELTERARAAGLSVIAPR